MRQFCVQHSFHSFDTFFQRLRPTVCPSPPPYMYLHYLEINVFCWGFLLESAAATSHEMIIKLLILPSSSVEFLCFLLLTVVSDAIKIMTWGGDPTGSYISSYTSRLFLLLVNLLPLPLPLVLCTRLFIPSPSPFSGRPAHPAHGHKGGKRYRHFEDGIATCSLKLQAPTTQAIWIQFFPPDLIKREAGCLRLSDSKGRHYALYCRRWQTWTPCLWAKGALQGSCTAQRECQVYRRYLMSARLQT